MPVSTMPTMQSTHNSNIYVTSTKVLEDNFSAVSSDQECQQELNNVIDRSFGDKAVSFTSVQKLQELLSRARRSNADNPVYLHELLEGSNVILPDVPKVPRNPELEARIQRLKDQQANKTYQKMVEGIDIAHIQDRSQVKSLGKEMKEMNRQLIAVFNFLVTVGGAFAFAYKAAEYSMEVPNVPIQLCAGFVLGTIVFFADLYFLVRYNLD